MKRLELLDYGRFTAALAVVAFHYFFSGIQNGKVASITYVSDIVNIAKYGYLGVEFFFMISGYVIFFSAKGRTASQFAVSRFVRLYPAFWIAVIITSIAAYFLGGAKMSVTIHQSLFNLTMFPTVFGYGFVDGVYWTLQYELAFYLAVLFFLLFGWRGRLEHVFLCWPLVMVAAWLLHLQNVVYLGGYYSYFAAGAIFAIQRDKFKKISIISLILCFALCVKFSCNMAADLSKARDITFSTFVVSAIITIQFIFFFILNSRFGSSLKIVGSRLVGGLTYPLYLIHAHLGYMLLSRFANEDNKVWISCVVIALVLVVAFAIYTLVEKRYSKFWQRLFQRSIGNAVDALDKRLFNRLSSKLIARS